MSTVDWEHNRWAQNSILDVIGRTPTVRLQRVAADCSAEIFVKLEYYSPSGSLKDRIYRAMIGEAERRGDLKPGMTILECSTGNAGIACAFVASVKAYRCIIVMPEGMSEERKKMDRAYGAELVFTPGGESDVDLALDKLREIRESDPERYWVPAQFDNPDNVEAHYSSTGPELWEQLDEKVDAYVATQGTGGALTGIGRYFRERNPAVELFAVEPAECPLLSRRKWGSHRIEGIGDGFVPRVLELSQLTGVVTTTSDEALAMARRLAKEEGIFCGISSGSNVAAALKLARERPNLKRIATMINDSGQRYFTTELCGEVKEVDIPERDHPMDPHTIRELDQYQKNWVLID